ncbi:hypothetical protein AKG37_11495 [Bacillus australimaris]|uniref:Uncharacterized protein n=1 Tax=Bacillus australimaris TaxID=1326968 RepID=A0ABR5MSE4_9BACI|nr:hypothetical protein AKG37_11495 [Bacillus australimaris]
MSGLKRQNVCAKEGVSITDAFPTSPINRRGFDVIERLVSWLVNLQAFHPSHPYDSGFMRKALLTHSGGTAPDFHRSSQLKFDV